MLSAIQNTPASVTFHEMGKTTSSSSLGARIRNVLFGRVCANWEDHILSIGVVYYVAKAAFSFFTGSWTVSLIELFTSGLLANMRIKLRRFANLRKETGEMNKQNNQFIQSNFNFRQNLEKFKSQIQQLSQEREKMAQENNRFATSNTTYKKHLDTMERTLDSAIGEIAAATRRGKNVSKEVLSKALQSFDAQKKMLATMEKELIAKGDEATKRWGDLVEQVGTMNADGVNLLKDANNRLQTTLQEIAAAQAIKKTLEEQIERLQQSADRIDNSTLRLERATGFFQFLFKGLRPDGNQEDAVKVYTAFAVAGAIATLGYRMLTTAS